MASKALEIFACILPFFLIFPRLNMSSSHVILKHNSDNKNSSSLLFLKSLRGCRVGDTVQGIHWIKKYLERFGYMTNAMDDDIFDHVLESAIKTYQENHNIAASGNLNSKTLAQMAKPRCGVEDVINGSTWMRSGRKRNENGRHGHGHLFTVSQFAFFNGKPKWPASKFCLSYAFLPGSPSEAFEAVERAFKKWDSKTQFRFSLISDHKKADIKISFEIDDHGDYFRFDGTGAILAHAFPPTDGRLHFDADEPWSVGALDGYFDVETVALHEIGHLLGLQHSSVEEAIMFPAIPEGATKGLHADDIAGIKALYGV